MELRRNYDHSILSTEAQVRKDAVVEDSVIMSGAIIGQGTKIKRAIIGEGAIIITTELKDVLAPTLETYKLSVTHLNNFLDVSRGGPQNFLLNNLLRFPSAKSPAASYGTAIHASLQQLHNLLRADGYFIYKSINSFRKKLAL